LSAAGRAEPRPALSGPVPPCCSQPEACREIAFTNMLATRSSRSWGLRSEGLLWFRGLFAVISRRFSRKLWLGHQRKERCLGMVRQITSDMCHTGIQEVRGLLG